MDTNNLKPFNLEEALAGRPVVTRDGKQVNEIHRFKSADRNGQHLCAISHGESIWFWDDGRYSIPRTETPWDLFMASVEKTFWVNLYGENNAGTNGNRAAHYSSEAEADAGHGDGFRIGGKAHLITYTE